MSWTDLTRTEGTPGQPAPDVRGLAIGGAIEAAHLPRSLRWRHEQNGVVLRLDIAWPNTSPPPEGYPLVVVTDANAMFATMVETVRLQSVRTEGRSAGEPVVLGIGHDTDALFDIAARMRDYAPPGSTALADRLSALMIALGRLIPLCPERCTLAGHSLGGLFALTVLFSRPELFSRYVAVSPSIWRARDMVANGAARLPARLSGLARRHLMLIAGGLERGVPLPQDALRFGPERRQLLAERRVVEEAEALALRLAGDNTDRLGVQFHVFEGESHASVVPFALSRAARFALEDS